MRPVIAGQVSHLSGDNLRLDDETEALLPTSGGRQAMLVPGLAAEPVSRAIHVG